MVNLLLKNGLNAEAKDEVGDTALSIVCTCRWRVMIDAF